MLQGLFYICAKKEYQNSFCIVLDIPIKDYSLCIKLRFSEKVTKISNFKNAMDK